MAYVLKKPQPTIIKIEGSDKEYLIPPLAQMSVDEVAEVLALTPETPASERILACKRFLLRHCPDLANEDIGDYGFGLIFGAYEREQGLGK